MRAHTHAHTHAIPMNEKIIHLNGANWPEEEKSRTVKIHDVKVNVRKEN